MRHSSLILLAWAMLWSSGQAAQAPPPLRWFPGDPSVRTRPAVRFNAAERAKQAAKGGLSWIVLQNPIRDRALALPNLAQRLPSLRSPRLTLLEGVRWPAPRPITNDLVCVGVPADLPLPQADAQSLIDWAARLGGAAILTYPDKDKLERYGRLLQRLAAFEAFRFGRWNPECLEGGAWDRLLSAGIRLCIVGGPASREKGTLGRGAVVTYVLARSHQPADIVEGLRSGHTVVAQEDAIRLNFAVDGAPPGATIVPRGGTVKVAIEMWAREPVREIKILGNVRTPEAGARAKVLLRIDRPGRQAAGNYVVRIAPSTRYLRAEAVIGRGRCRTLTSPVFVGVRRPAELAPGAHRKLLRMIAGALGRLDWADKGRALRVVEQLLDDPRIGPPTAMYIAMHFNRRELDRIRPLLGSRRARVRAHMACILMRIEGKAALPAVLKMLDDRDPRPRLYAARQLARFAATEHQALAMKAAGDRWPGVRQYALAALARIPGRDSLLRLRQALHSRIPAVRQAAATQVGLLLGVRSDRRRSFLEAFKAGSLSDALLNSAVTHGDLRPLAAEIALDPLGRHDPAETSGPATGAIAPKGRVLSAELNRGRPPRIDGKGDDPAWARALTVTGFVLANGHVARHQTRVSVLYDPENVYLLIRCAEPNVRRLVARATDRDGNVADDDSVDVYLCTTRDGRTAPSPAVFRFSVNARGVSYDARLGQRGWNGRWQAAAAVGTREWTAEMAIPYRTLGAPLPRRHRTKWLIQVVRRRRVPPEETSFLQRGDPRNPARYADLKFQ